MKKITKYKNYLLVVIGILLALTMLVGVKYLMKPKFEELPEVKLKDIKSKKSFAIMVQNGDGYEEYISEDNTWPGDEYVYKEAKCTDNNGALIENVITFTDGKATLRTNQTIYCTLYFDEKSKVEITNANKVCDMGTSMSIEFSTSDSVAEYYYSTNGKDFTKSSENLYSIQKLVAGTNQKIYVYVTDSNGKRSETKEYDFVTKTLGKSMTASELKASKPKDLNTNDIKTQGGMYRYQGTNNVDNWIVFGTNECTNEYVNEKIDKYMYRIIGITEEGQLYLIKETFLKEGTTDAFVWNSKNFTYECLEGNCEWPNVDIYKRINGTSNGETSGTGSFSEHADTDIFVDNQEYDYLKSGDKNGTNDGIGSEWYTLIADHKWMYGDTNQSSSDSNTYNGDYMYGIETGNTATTRWWPDEEHGQTKCSSDNQCTEKPYTWSKSTNAKIGLMYMHDVDYAYANCSSGECSSRGNPGSSINVENSWIYSKKDGYNTSRSSEWLITRFGALSSSNPAVEARELNSGYILGSFYLYGVSDGARPVFYLSSKAQIASGSGTKSDPFILEI